MHGPLAHDALLYRTLDELQRGVGLFVEDGLAAGEPVLVAAPPPHIAALRLALGRRAGDGVRFVDMERLGRNPSCIIPFVREWVDGHGGRRVRFVGEPIWPGRGPREVVEATRHEGLINLAFEDANATILCPYDAAGLDASAIADAYRTHPTIRGLDGARRASARYTDPHVVYRGTGSALPAPAGPVDELAITYDLGRLRAFVAHQARAGGMRGERLDDLLLAANEAATNALVHSGRPGVVRVWRDDGHLVCEFTDGGGIDDPLAGRRRPDASRAGGRGLWLINQLCDLVGLRPGPPGTTLRLHMAL
jgi:anti-sigma regulatory factor (Ser/Thr protein kinase)